MHAIANSVYHPALRVLSGFPKIGVVVYFSVSAFTRVFEEITLFG